MKSYFLLLTFLILSFSCQKENTDNNCWVFNNGQFEFLEPDVVPVYKDGGEDGFYIVIGEELSYPAEARNAGIEGMVILSYQVSESGTVDATEIVTDIGGGCGEAALVALIAATEGASFYPAELDGVNVRVRKDLEIEFSLE